MEQGIAGRRLPTTDSRRTELRDAKMWRRETERQRRTGTRTSRCPCTLCMFGKPLLRTTQAKHLRDYGRHPAKRLQEEVNSLAPLNHKPSMHSQNIDCIPEWSSQPPCLPQRTHGSWQHRQPMCGDMEYEMWEQACGCCVQLLSGMLDVKSLCIFGAGRGERQLGRGMGKCLRQNGPNIPNGLEKSARLHGGSWRPTGEGRF